MFTWNRSSVVVPGLDFNDDVPALLSVLDQIAELKAIGDQHVCLCGLPLYNHDSELMKVGEILHPPENAYIYRLDSLERQAEALGYNPRDEGERIWSITKAICGRS